MEKGKQWYRSILEKDPVFDAPFAVVFAIGESELVLAPQDGPAPSKESGPIAYWAVDDVDSVYKHLIQLGATRHSEINSVVGTRIASVTDPFGNVLGIRGNEADKQKASVEHRPSESAQAVAFMRALAALDGRESIRGGDYLAEKFLTEERRNALKNPAVREWMMKTPPGLYEYTIARTAFFDRVVEQALGDNLPQIVFLGAGYDSRPYRFRDRIKDTRIFEMDAPPTQQRKKELLQKANISVPGRLTYISVNFKTDDLSDLLNESGFDRNKETLFIWEGVTFYLMPEVVDATLQFIKSSSKPGSSVCFDCSALSPKDLDGYGVKELQESMKASFPGEATFFAIEKGKIASFLSERGFAVIEHLTPEDMEKRYLTLRDGSSAGKVTAMFNFVHASTT
jgi:methyltransferase (TIGR00027 family)